MSRTGARRIYTVVFESGDTADNLDERTVREMIAGGLLGVNDRVGRDGSEPTEFFLYDEFVDLWDLDDVTFHLQELEPIAEEPATQPSSAPSSPPPPAEDIGDPPRAAVDPDDPTAQPLVQVAAGPDSVERLGALAAEMSASQLPPEISGGHLEVPMGFEISEMGMSAPAGAREMEAPDDGEADQEAQVSEEDDRKGGDSGAFEGYDPLQDEFLDAETVRDLLFDSSLYTVLAIGHDATDRQIKAAYRHRAELLAGRQRGKRLEPRTLAALEDIRRLVFQSYEFLRRPKRRKDYDRSRTKEGGFAPARERLGLEPIDPDSAEFRSSTALSSLREDARDTRPSGELASLGVTLTGAPVLSARLSTSVREGEGEARKPSGSGPRIYRSAYKRMGTPDDPARALPGGSEARPSTGRHGAAAMGRRPGSSAPSRSAIRPSRTADAALAPTHLPLEWGSESDRAGPGMAQAAAGTGLVMAASIPTVLLTDLGIEELRYVAPSLWFYCRCGLLIAVAVFMTLVLRKEPIWRFGLGGSLLGIATGLGVGMAAGVAAALAWPEWSATGTSLAIVAATVLLQAFSHELWFRGFVTRVLLLERRNPLVAIALSCVFYGVSFLSYYTMFERVELTRLLYGVGLAGLLAGGVLSWLYYSSKSIWPGVAAHFLALYLTFVIG